MKRKIILFILAIILILALIILLLIWKNNTVEKSVETNSIEPTFDNTEIDSTNTEDNNIFYNDDISSEYESNSYNSSNVENANTSSNSNSSNVENINTSSTSNSSNDENTDDSTSSNSSNSNSSLEQESEPVHTHSWKDHTAQRWVSNWVTVVDTPSQTITGAQLYTLHSDGNWYGDGEIYWFENGFTSDDFKDILKAKIKNEGYIGNYVNRYKTIPAVTHEEDQGYYETYVDYQYCDCGATR